MRQYYIDVVIDCPSDWTIARARDFVIRQLLSTDQEKQTLKVALVYPPNCPTCDSPQPQLHPAMQFEGEVQVCRDPWHDRPAWSGPGYSTLKNDSKYCQHPHLNEDGICRACGADKRGIGE